MRSLQLLFAIALLGFPPIQLVQATPAPQVQPQSIQIQGELSRTLHRDPHTRQQEEPVLITVKNPTMSPIEIPNAPNLSVETLDLKVGLVIDEQGSVLQTRIYDDSPTLKEHPELKDTAASLVQALFLSTDSFFTVKLQFDPTGNEQLFYRIARVQIRVSKK